MGYDKYDEKSHSSSIDGLSTTTVREPYRDYSNGSSFDFKSDLQNLSNWNTEKVYRGYSGYSGSGVSGYSGYSGISGFSGYSGNLSGSLKNFSSSSRQPAHSSMANNIKR